MLCFVTACRVGCLCPIVAAVLLALSPTGGAPLFAEQAQPAEHRTSQTGAADSARHSQQEHGVAHHHRHDAAVFLGGSTEKGVRGFTLGGEYELRFHRLVGVGVVGEYAGGALRESVFAFPFTVHPYRGVRLLAGPGFVRSSGSHGPDSPESGGESSHSTKGNETKTKALLRFGIGYDFPVFGSFAISPAVAIDVLEREEVLVFGVSFAFGF